MTVAHLFEAIRETGREYGDVMLRGIVARAERFQVLYPSPEPITEDRIREIMREEICKYLKAD